LRGGLNMADKIALGPADVRHLEEAMNRAGGWTIELFDMLCTKNELVELRDKLSRQRLLGVATTSPVSDDDDMQLD